MEFLEEKNCSVVNYFDFDPKIVDDIMIYIAFSESPYFINFFVEKDSHDWQVEGF